MRLKITKSFEQLSCFLTIIIILIINIKQTFLENYISTTTYIYTHLRDDTSLNGHTLTYMLTINDRNIDLVTYLFPHKILLNIVFMSICLNLKVLFSMI